MLPVLVCGYPRFGLPTEKTSRVPQRHLTANLHLVQTPWERTPVATYPPSHWHPSPSAVHPSSKTLAPDWPRLTLAPPDNAPHQIAQSNPRPPPRCESTSSVSASARQRLPSQKCVRIPR